MRVNRHARLARLALLLAVAIPVAFASPVSAQTVTASVSTGCSTLNVTAPSSISSVVVRHKDGTEQTFSGLSGTSYATANNPANPIIHVSVTASGSTTEQDVAIPTGCEFYDVVGGASQGVTPLAAAGPTGQNASGEAAAQASSDLPFTGSDNRLARAAVGALIAGFALLVLVRRRRLRHA